jgi:hypothetical protein
MFDRVTALMLIQSEDCPCNGCTGQLTSPARSPGGWGFCKTCRCAWQVSMIDGHAYAATIPSRLHLPAPSSGAGPRD